MNMARRVKRLRKHRRLTLEETGLGAGVPKSCIWDIENNRVSRPSADSLLAIARFFGVSVEFILEGANDPAFSNFEISALFNRVSRLGAKKQKHTVKMIKILLED